MKIMKNIFEAPNYQTPEEAELVENLGMEIEDINLQPEIIEKINQAILKIADKLNNEEDRQKLASLLKRRLATGKESGEKADDAISEALGAYFLNPDDLIAEVLSMEGEDDKLGSTNNSSKEFKNQKKISLLAVINEILSEKNQQKITGKEYTVSDVLRYLIANQNSKQTKNFLDTIKENFKTLKGSRELIIQALKDLIKTKTMMLVLENPELDKNIMADKNKNKQKSHLLFTLLEEISQDYGFDPALHEFVKENIKKLIIINGKFLEKINNREKTKHFLINLFSATKEIDLNDKKKAKKVFDNLLEVYSKIL